MEKLELKHLAGYLPYGLKVMYGTNKLKELVLSLHQLIDSENEYLPVEYCFGSNSIAKPILRPLSDLTKEIEVNGEKFPPMVKLVKTMHPDKDFHFLETSKARNVQSVRYKYHSGRNTVCDTINIYTEELNSGNKYCFNILNTDWWIIQKLYEWHFDIHGLIPKGLAIDKNTII